MLWQNSQISKRNLGRSVAASSSENPARAYDMMPPIGTGLNASANAGSRYGMSASVSPDLNESVNMERQTK